MQLTLNFEAGLVESYPSCREYVAARVHQQGRPQKAIAMDMDYSPSDLSRKLAQNPDDSRRFTLDDLETYIDVTGDTSPVLYFVEKYFSQTKDEIAALEARLNELKGANNDHR
jgi:hypothetical protein